MIAELNKEETIVISWLKSHGYYKVVSNHDLNGIEADGKMRKMMVFVRTPETQSDVENLRKLALKNHREPWVAVVEPDDDVMWYTVK